MNQPIDDRLQQYFDEMSRHDRLGETPVRLVMRRGNRRRARRRAGVMAGTLAVGALSSVAAARTLTGGDSRRAIQVGNDGSAGNGGTPVPDATGASGATEAGPSGLVWNEITVGSAEAVAQAWTNDLVGSTDDGYYAVSTEPGRSPASIATLYRSADGLHWQPAGTPPDHLSNRSALALAADRLYAVGTIAATSPTGSKDPGAAVLTSSPDGGATWDDHTLPIDLDALRALPAVSAVMLSTAVTGGDAGVLVAGVSHASIDPQQIAPDGVDPMSLLLRPDAGVVVQHEVSGTSCGDEEEMYGGPMDTAPAADGVATTTTTILLDTTVPAQTAPPDTCRVFGDVARTYSWAELGVDDATAAAALGQLHLFTAADGTTFTTQQAPELPAGWYVQRVRVASTPDGYVLIVGVSRSETDDANDETTTTQRTFAYSSADGATWTPLPDIPVPWVETIATLDDGALAVSSSDGITPMFAVLRDGAWHTTRAFDIVGGHPSLSSWPGVQTIGAFGFAAVVQAGEPVTVDHPVTDTTWPAVATTAVGIDPSTQRTLLITSRDGLTWAVDDIGDLIGPDRYLESIRQIDGQVALNLGSYTGAPFDPDAPLPDRTVLVGTPAG